MDIKEAMELCVLRGAVEAVVQYIISTPRYELNKVLILRMLDVGGVGYAEELKEENE